jgi:hypothetical protein
MTKGWVKIYSSFDFFKSEIVRQVLIDHEIEAVILDKQGFPYKLGDVEVYIHEVNFQKAIEIIISNEL